MGRFLFYCRPRGKPVPKGLLALQPVAAILHVQSTHFLFVILGDDIKIEAWVLRNLITLLKAAARRPHTPRSPEMRHLFRAIGIDVPDQPQEGSLAKSFLFSW